MRILVTGAKGQLGTDLMDELSKRNISAVGVDIDEMDITDELQVNEVIDRECNSGGLDAIIHCAAHTAVDKAEDEPGLVRLINATGTENIAKACNKHGLTMMYISTDYVFDGEGTVAWKPDDERHPLNVYGQMKYEGELAVEKYVKNYFIVRISWVFGLRGNNFVKTMIKLGKERGEVSVINDQVGSPTYTPDLARLLVDMIQTDKYGRYHATNEGLCSWYDYALEIYKQTGLDVKVTAVTSEAFAAKAKRPHNSRMDKSKLTENGFKLMPTWQDALSRYIEVLKKEGLV